MGSAAAVCTKFGNWSYLPASPAPAPPQCAPDPCSLAAPPAHGSVGTCGAVAHGASCAVGCAAGYRIAGAASQLCQFGALSDGGSPQTCQREISLASPVVVALLRLTRCVLQRLLRSGDVPGAHCAGARLGCHSQTWYSPSGDVLFWAVLIVLSFGCCAGGDGDFGDSAEYACDTVRTFSLRYMLIPRVAVQLNSRLPGLSFRVTLCRPGRVPPIRTCARATPAPSGAVPACTFGAAIFPRTILRTDSPTRVQSRCLRAGPSRACPPCRPPLTVSSTSPALVPSIPWIAQILPLLISRL